MLLIRKIVVPLLMLILLVVPASADDGQSLFVVSVPTALGQELANDARWWVSPSSAEWQTTFVNTRVVYDPSSSWTAFVTSETWLSETCTQAFPDVINGILWSGMAESRTDIPLEVRLSGVGWGNRRFSLWQPDDTLITSTTMTDGSSFSATFAAFPLDLASANNGYRYRLEKVPETSGAPAVPELPASALAAIGGLGGLALRSRRR